MKLKFLLFLSLVILLGSYSVFAQAPQQFNYQGAARNANGTPLANKNINLRLSLLDGSPSGVSQYSETRSVLTNALGLYHVIIGSPGATSTSGNIADVTWSSGLKYIKVEIDPNNGSNFSVAGSAQLLSVPYALFAAASGTGTGNVTADNGITKTGSNIQLGGALLNKTKITTTVDNTLAIEGLQPGSSTVDRIVVTDASGVLKTIAPIALAPPTNFTSDNGLTKTGSNTQLGGDLTKPTVINTSASNTLAINGLQPGSTGDRLVVVGANGVLKAIADFSILKGEKGADGKSAFDIWREIPGNDGKSIAEFLEGIKGATGAKGDTGTGISGTTVNNDGTITITYTDGTSQTTTSSVKGATGAKGDTGTGISGTTVNNDGTITITYTDGTSQTTTTSVKGATGATGPKGDTGADGLGGRSTAGTGITITGAGTQISPYVIATSPADADKQTITSQTLDATTNVLSTTIERGNTSTVDLSPLKVEPWNKFGTTEKATLNNDQIYTLGTWVGIGTNTKSAAADEALRVNGKIRTTASVYADYVFEDYFKGFSEINKDYKFKSLDEVAEFIRINKHLPGVTPIKDVEKVDGGYALDITTLSVQTLEKVEELYLHLIEQQKLIEAKNKEIQALKKATEDLNERLKKLEKLLEK